MSDIDTEWNATHGLTEQPAEFRARMLNGRLTKDEAAAVAGLEPEAAFVKLHPDYVSLDAHRKQVLSVKPDVVSVLISEPVDEVDAE